MEDVVADDVDDGLLFLTVRLELTLAGFVGVVDDGLPFLTVRFGYKVSGTVRLRNVIYGFELAAGAGRLEFTTGRRDFARGFDEVVAGTGVLRAGTGFADAVIVTGDFLFFTVRGTTRLRNVIYELEAAAADAAAAAAAGAGLLLGCGRRVVVLVIVFFLRCDRVSTIYIYPYILSIHHLSNILKRRP